MRDFLLSQLDGQNGEGVTDLCLDYKLIAEFHPAKFKQIDGLSHFPDLKILSISMQALQNLSGLPLLTKLIELDLSLNEISDISGIPNLPNLQKLFLQHNEISQLGNISFPSTLRELNLSFNYFSDTFSLENAPYLEILLLNGNRKIHGLGNLPLHLQRLQVRQCFIQDFSAISALKKLHTLGLSPGNQTDLTFLENLPSLEKLTLTGHRLGNSLALPILPKLRQLQIVQAPEIQEVLGLDGFLNLQTLEISNVRLEKLPDLAGMDGLEIVKIKASPLSELKGLFDLPNLKELHLKETLVSNAVLNDFKNAQASTMVFLN